jgi:glycosyltransferase involved in cell wall biosynthesis
MRPPADRSILDDIAMRRPWNLRVKAARARARLRLRRLETGVTVVIVNWNTGELTADVVKAVQHFSPLGTRVMLIDNGSSDDSRERFENWPRLTTRFLQRNAGHGVALDLGICWSRTDVTVALDSDAIPLRHGWLELAVDAIRDDGALLAGLRSRRGFVHPVYLAIDTAHFIRSRMSFQVHRDHPADGAIADEWGVNAWDTGELLTRVVPADRVRFVDPVPNRVAGLPGMTVGDVVYHHGGVSRGSDGCVSPGALTGWRHACEANGLVITDHVELVK